MRLEWFLGDRDLTNPTINNGVMTIETPAAEVVPKRQIVDPLAGSPVSRSADICVRFSWPPSSIPDDVPEVGIITHAFFGFSLQCRTTFIDWLASEKLILVQTKRSKLRPNSTPER